MRRALSLDRERREAAEGIAQSLDHSLGAGPPRRVHGEPTRLRIDPCTYHLTPRQRAGAQLVAHTGAQIAHLLASDGKTLLLSLFLRALLGNLADDRPRKQLLVDA